LTQVGFRSNGPPLQSTIRGQRVAVARALKQTLIFWQMNLQEILIVKHRRNHETFNEIHGNTVILVTHEEEIAEYAHRIIR
jgi:putative ABC transport system ATP-binding protein